LLPQQRIDAEATVTSACQERALLGRSCLSVTLEFLPDTRRWAVANRKKLSSGTIAAGTVKAQQALRSNTMTMLPLWTWITGALVLGTFIAYGIFRNSRRTRRERIISNEATKKLYGQENRSN
jgi:hypothetical protein